MITTRAKQNCCGYNKNNLTEIATISSSIHSFLDFFFWIALIRLPEPIKDKYVKPAKLPKSTSKALGDVAVVTAGTGYTQIEQTTSDHILRHAEFVTIPSSECEKDFNGPFIALSVVCTKTINGSAFYKGDSGKSYGDDWD